MAFAHIFPVLLLSFSCFLDYQVLAKEDSPACKIRVDLFGRESDM